MYFAIVSKYLALHSNHINTSVGQELPELTPVEIDINPTEAYDIGLNDEWLTLFVKSYVLTWSLSINPVMEEKQEATRSLVVW